MRRPQAARLDRKRAGAHARTSAAPPPTPSRPGRAEAPPRSPRAARGRCDGRPALDPFQPLQQRGLRRRRGGQQHPRAEQFQQQSRRRRPAHLDQARVQDLAVPHQRGGSEPRRLLHHALDLVRGDVHEPALRGVRDRLDEREVAQPLEQVRREAARVEPGLDEAVDRLEHGRPVAGRQRVDDVVDQRDVRDPEQRHRPLVRDPFRPGAREELVEHRQRVAGRAASRAQDQRVHRGGDDGGLFGADALQKAAQGARRDQPERVVVRARPDRRQNLLGLGGREDEDEMVRWLLDDLEQGVEALRGDHVRLVDDEHPVARLGGRVEGTIPQFTGVVDPAVRGGVQLDDVDVPRPFGRERDARRAHTARVGRRALHAVERAGEDARRRRLPAPAGPGEQVRVVDPAGFERDAQRPGDVLLPDDVGEPRRAVLAVQSQRHAARLPTAGAAVGRYPEDERTPRTRQSPLTLAAFRPWGSSQDGRRAGPVEEHRPVGGSRGGEAKLRRGGFA